MDPPMFIAVHVGAGHLSRKKEKRYRSVCARACRRAMELLKQGESAVNAVSAAIAILEDDQVTNAGYGSNLTLHASVECDASLMDGQTAAFGAVAAVPGVRNPIQVCQEMVHENNRGLLALGRIPPMMLCGSGAKEWAKQRGLATVVEKDQISSEAMDTYVTCMQMLQDAVKTQPATEEQDRNHDTVGAICIDGCGNIASGVSSGGILLKSPGRIGEAAMFGSGCWAENKTSDGPGLACSVSGTGEQIVRSDVTRKLLDRLRHQDDLHAAMTQGLQRDFLDSPSLAVYDEKSVGLIALRWGKRLEFWYGHVTESMGVGYMSSASPGPKTLISRKAPSMSVLSSGLII
ncbi:N-terminal nucleophile aminohydrolase [Hesseltinella vesiculosa]|uniref:N-terminal nucleophile aminohydrolase n=1 Tax=Hesseltinella vesiculosa TaxID=101127 RepID=A0A1X2GR53_9FUNG|nr:N-terminal nucleophile aminohydrolase [Hesseltinella vesiculosa]